MFRASLSKVLLLTFLFYLPVAAQTSGEFRQRFAVTSAVDAFEVKPGIVATVFYGEDGQVVQTMIRPRLFYARDNSNKEMPFKAFGEVLLEFAPVAKRGRLCNESEFVSGRNYYVTSTYEHASVYSVIHNRGADNATASLAEITWNTWEKTYCPPTH